MNYPRPRLAFTVVELLVVTVIFSILMSLLVVGGQPSAGGQIRRLAQSIVSAILTAQTSALGNEAGAAVIFEPSSTTSNACNALFFADSQPYIKGTVGSGVPPSSLASTSTTVALTPTNADAADLANGYKILFRCDEPYLAASPWMSISSGTTVAFRTSANQTAQNTIWPKKPATAPLQFLVARYPVKSSPAIDGIKTAAIDLRYSGIGNTTTGDYGALANKGAIAITFNSAGVIDAVMQNVLATTKSVQPVVPAAPLYLLIASLSDIQSNESLQKEYSLWLVLAPNTGRITIASNVIQNGTAEVDVINARAKARQSIAVK